MLLMLMKTHFRYQYGPDTYLLQLRDTNFPTRLREYIKVAKGRSPSFNYSITDSNYDLSVSFSEEIVAAFLIYLWPLF